LFDLYRKNIPFASYISAPKSRELVNLIKLYLCNGNVSNQESYKPVEYLVDTTIASFFIVDGQRTGVFRNHSPISEEYPDVVHPYFFYLHVGTEIGRVEIPAWIAQDSNLTDQVASIIYDQAIKGRGYPVAIAEAHEQAVVKGPDRDFFYHLIAKMSLERKRKMGYSQKMVKKLGMGI
jgi:NurA domain.